MDLRIVKTEKALKEAFAQLLLEKDFQNITVNELCDKAMIRRTTFYKHYQDKYDYFDRLIKQEVEDILQPCFSLMNAMEFRAFFQDMLMRCLDYVASRKKTFQSAFSSYASSLFEDTLTKEVSDILYKKLVMENVRLKIKGDVKIVALSYTGILFQILKYWVKESTKPIGQFKKELLEVGKTLVDIHADF